jgi:pimeloyl-ACP methyl ester carboxylesterase
VSEVRSRRPRIAAVVALGAGAAAAAGWALQHRSVARAAVTEQDIAAEGLVLPEGLVRRFVDADDGGRIHVVERGTGPAIVLLHGFMLDSSIWAHQLRDLSDRHRVIAIDHRGHGESLVGSGGFALTSAGGGTTGESLHAGAPMASAGVGAPGIRRLSADLLAVLEELDLAEALLVGHSMGGMVALQLAQDSPQTIRRRISGLVLTSTLAGPFTQLPGWAGLARVAAPASARAVLLAERVSVAALPSQDLRYWLVRLGFGGDAPPAQVRFTEALHLATPSRTVAGLLPSLAVFNLSASLGSMEEPVLVVVGTRDRLTPPRQARRMVNALPLAELVELPRCGHMTMIERPREFSHMLDEFSAKTRNRSL